MRVAAFDVGVVNMVYVVIDTCEDSFNIIHWCKFAIGNKSTTCMKATDALVRVLERDVSRFIDVDAVVIEQQMVTRMTVLSHVIQAWFLAAQIRGDLGARVTLQSAGKKARLGPWLKRLGRAAVDEQGQHGYAANKRNAIEDARQALSIQTDQAWVDFFENHPKKDDLADALLHALWFAFGSP